MWREGEREGEKGGKDEEREEKRRRERGKLKVRKRYHTATHSPGSKIILSQVFNDIIAGLSITF